jgi:hypothetical protein
MQILHECKDSRDSHYAHCHSQKKRDGVLSEFLRAGDANMFREMDENALLDHLESIDLCHSNRQQRSTDNILEVKLCAENSGIFGKDNEMVSGDAPMDSRHDLVLEHSPALEQSWEKNSSDRKDAWKKVAQNERAKSARDEPSVDTGSSSRGLL